jgi:acetylglutamate kinase
MEHLILIKVGGRIVEEERGLKRLLYNFSKVEGAKALVYGGGRMATGLAERFDIHQ